MDGCLQPLEGMSFYVALALMSICMIFCLLAGNLFVTIILLILDRNVSTVTLLFELICVRDGLFTLSMSAHDINELVRLLCTA